MRPSLLLVFAAQGLNEDSDINECESVWKAAGQYFASTNAVEQFGNELSEKSKAAGSLLKSFQRILQRVFRKLSLMAHCSRNLNIYR